jgi:hypothetical protein
VKGQHHDSTAGREALRQRPQQPLERGELVVHRNAQSLKRTADRRLDVGLLQIRKRRAESRAHKAIDGVGRLERLLLEEAGDELGVRFIGVLLKQARELLFAQARQQLRAGFTTRWIHPHVEGTDPFVAEAAIGIVELHRGHAQVREDQVRGRQSLSGEHLWQPSEVAAACDEGLGAEAVRA